MTFFRRTIAAAVCAALLSVAVAPAAQAANLAPAAQAANLAPAAQAADPSGAASVPASLEVELAALDLAADGSGPVALPTGGSPPEYYDGGVLDYYSRALFWFNRQVYNGLNAFTEALAGGMPDFAKTQEAHEAGLGGPARTAFGRGLGNMASNLINEPVTMLASAATGDFSTAANALGRFGINTTVGMLGWNDVAAEWGMQPNITDIGLVMCRAGVGEGGYLVLPFIGPRTVRDGFADVILVNAVLWTLIGASLGTGATLQTVLIAESIEVVADIIATRQIDPNAKVVRFDDFEAVRKGYLEQRRARCAQS